MRRALWFALLIPAPALVADPPKFTLVESAKIWDAAPHNAFTDLIRHDGRFLCVFREGEKHVSKDGKLRVIASADGKTWDSLALLKSDTGDLRDAKITATPDGKLMLLGAEALHKPTPHTHQSLTWFSIDGKSWSDPARVADPGYWLWRVTWVGKDCLGLGYGCGPEPKRVRLYRSRDGKSFDRVGDNLFDQGYPNESSILVQPDGTALCLLRRDAGTATAQLGTSKPPYTDWTWKDLGVRIGGPHLLRLPDGTIMAAVRLYDKPERTALCVLDPAASTLIERLPLPSGGDSSYAGMVWHDDRLWVSYYSSHEKKTSIYLAQIKVGK